ncbi:MAG TPA: sulfatase-like hydrolase/transferase [Thermoplasmata archaeon]|nr:sulfatase-like hydrolase/transferase [Thermoplasmata archaeon]
MKRYKRFYLFVFLLLLTLFTVLSPLFSKTDSKDVRLNFLLITIDTLRPDRLSCYNSEHLNTPNIDSLAEKGVLFSKAFAHTCTTLPSHTNILLGTTPLYHGVHDNSNFIVRKEFLNLAEHLKKYGYSTAAFIGAFPLDSRFGLTEGFDVYDDNYGSKSSQEFSYVERRAEIVVQKALGWLEERTSPWFLWVHCFDPHQRYDPPEPFKTKHKNNLYDGEVAYVNFTLGKLFEYLEEKKLNEKTLVVFTADHGESLGEHGESTHGYFAYNSTIWVPLIISFPGINPKKIDQNVCHTDIYPTVCDILNIEKPSFLQGVSLLPAIKGKKLSKRAIYFESLYPYYSRGWAPLKGYIEGNGKFIDSPIPEFYDLERDFDELENLAPVKKLNAYSKKLKKIIEVQSYKGEKKAEQKIDRESLDKLRSLGYVSSPQVSKKEIFSKKDDLKVLLSYQNKLMKAMGSYHKGNIEEGINLLREIISERKDFALAYTYLATLYGEQKRLKEAVEVMRDGIDNNPSSYKIFSSYGIFLTKIGQYDAAIEIFKKGLTLMDYDPEIWNYLGVAYWKKKDFEKALGAYQKALSLDNNYPIVFNNLGSLYLSLFLKTKSRIDHQKSLQNFKKAIELDPNYGSAYNGLGAAYQHVGNIKGAIYCWEKAVELNPDLGFALYNLGSAYLETGNKTKALACLTTYKEKHYRALPPKEKDELNTLIQKCKQK